MSNYPEWVNQFKQQGTSVKKVGNSYYLYKSTSKRVPGKKYPQPVQTFMGTITPSGLVLSKIRKISTERVSVYEYGFSYALKALLPEKFQKGIGNDETTKIVFLNIIQHFSPTSYLLRDMELPTMEEMHMSLSMQTKRYERLAGIKIKEVLPLCGLYLIETKECDMLSQVLPEMKVLLERLGVDCHETHK